MQCREGCGACCISPSISSAIPGMLNGKPADVLCVQLDGKYLCKIFGQAERPKVCSALKPSIDMCGDNREQALAIIRSLESQTS